MKGFIDTSISDLNVPKLAFYTNYLSQEICIWVWSEMHTKWYMQSKQAEWLPSP